MRQGERLGQSFYTKSGNDWDNRCKLSVLRKLFAINSGRQFEYAKAAQRSASNSVKRASHPADATHRGSLLPRVTLFRFKMLHSFVLAGATSSGTERAVRYLKGDSIEEPNGLRRHRQQNRQSECHWALATGLEVVIVGCL